MLNFVILKNFQKPPGRLFIAVRRLIILVCFPGSLVPPGDARRRKTCSSFLGSLMKGLAVMIEPLGNASHIGSILGFSGFWVDSDQRES